MTAPRPKVVSLPWRGEIYIVRDWTGEATAQDFCRELEWMMARVEDEAETELCEGV